MPKKSCKKPYNKGGFFHLFRKNKTHSLSKSRRLSYGESRERSLQKAIKKVKISKETKELALFNNEPDCLFESRKPKNKGAQCRLIGYANYALEKEVNIYRK